MPPLDVASGMMVYATSTPSHPTGRLRVAPEDFQVEEVLDLGEVSPDRTEDFPIPVYSVTKRGIDTPHVTAELADSLKSNVNFAGLKDSKAVTRQYASARSVRAADPAVVHGAKFEAERVGYLRRPMSRGMMVGNRFRISVTGPDDIKDDVTEVFRKCSERKVPNFFGYQRFGLRGMVNHEVGRAILKRDFVKAVGLFLGEPRSGERPEVSRAREAAAAGRYREAVGMFSRGQDLEKRVCRQMAEKPGDFLGGLRAIPIVQRRLFVQAYQSYLFNRTVSVALTAGLDISKPLPGDNWAEVVREGLVTGKVHGVREPLVAEGTVALIQIVGYAFRNYGSRFDRYILEILSEEEVEPQSFYIKEAEELSNEGGFRPAPLLVRDPSFAIEGGRSTLCFTLARGEYATSLLREVLKPPDPLGAGF